MIRVDFYIIPEQQVEACYAYVCRIVEKAYRQGHRAYLHTPSQNVAQRLDDLLWTYREESFIPHNLYSEKPTVPVPPPIQIGFEMLPQEHADILINLCPEIPDFYRQFQRVIEVVYQEPASLAHSRQHFKLYREQGCTLQSHDLTK